MKNRIFRQIKLIEGVSRVSFNLKAHRELIKTPLERVDVVRVDVCCF
jgi:hypothetical protein